ncbi:unnamed protein product [Effrenium voratum]|nr:unnamed protein product [Effrenium voratum]
MAEDGAYCFQEWAKGDAGDSAYAAALQERLRKVRAEVELQGRIALGLRRDLDHAEAQAAAHQQELAQLRRSWSDEQPQREGLLRETGDLERSLAQRERSLGERLKQLRSALSRETNVLEVLRETKAKLTLRNYNDALLECAKASVWQTTCEILWSMPELAVRPDISSFNSSIRSCKQGQQWQSALLLFECMPHHNISPDIISFNTTISSLEKGGQHKRAQSFFGNMMQD